MSVSEQEKHGSSKLCSCIINIAKMQSDCKNTGVLRDFHFVSSVAFACHLIKFSLQRRLQNWSLKRSKTVPKRSSKLLPSWKHFWDGFGTLLDSQMPLQARSLRRPRGIKKRLLFSLASQDASRMDLERHWTPWSWISTNF